MNRNGHDEKRQGESDEVACKAAIKAGNYTDYTSTKSYRLIQSIKYE